MCHIFHSYTIPAIEITSRIIQTNRIITGLQRKIKGRNFTTAINICYDTFSSEIPFIESNMVPCFV